MIRKVLVANRGEIAVRVIRACRDLGVETVAVHSDADRHALHVRLADEAVPIGPAPALESYLRIDTLIDAARETSADALHPGYGFLAENAELAAACAGAGIRFIGPEPDVIRAMGQKVEARRIAGEAGVPLVPGSDALDDPGSIAREARTIGLPVLIKASAGGGGKGMRVVRREADLESAADGARREARAAFGDPAVFVEKYLEEPRHVEIQVLADHHGAAVHLFERECSIQRRHQKILEETPSPGIDSGTRQKMGEAALSLVRASRYTNAGTVEFLVDRDGGFYFLEMNTRIQVEHPITEMVTGVDLVAWQVRIASGEKLGLEQQALSQRGHAIECRIYAEDPAAGFLPSPGRILVAREPRGPGVRCDSGILEGSDVPPDYDPILAKVVTHAETRDRAIARMRTALDDTVILGVETTTRFLRELLDHPEFLEGRTYTDFIPRHLGSWSPSRELPDEALVAAAVGARAGWRTATGRGREALPDPWATLGRFEVGHRIPREEKP